MKRALAEIAIAIALVVGVYFAMGEAMKIPIAPIHPGEVDVIPGPP